MKKLLTGKLEGCPATIFEDKYKKIRKEEFKDKQGIYALYDKNGQLYYVGRTSALMRRLSQHLKDRHSKKWEHFSLYFTRTEKDALALEAVFLSIYLPKGNRNKSSAMRVAKDTEMKRRIKKKMDEITRRVTAFRKPGISAKNKTRQKKTKEKGLKKTVSRAGKPKRLPLKDLFSQGFLKGRQPLKKEYKRTDKIFHAALLPSGKIQCQDVSYSYPSPAAKAATGKEKNGWTFWSIQNKSGEWITLSKFAETAALSSKAKTQPAAAGQEAFSQEKKKKNGKDGKPQLLNKGALALQAEYKGKIYPAKLLSCRKRVRFGDEIYGSPSAAAKAIAGYSVNGWTFWLAQTSPGKWVTLKSLKKSFAGKDS